MIVTVAASGIVTTLDIDRALAWQQALVFSGIVARVFSNPGCKQQPRIEGKNLYSLACCDVSGSFLRFLTGIGFALI